MSDKFDAIWRDLLLQDERLRGALGSLLNELLYLAKEKNAAELRLEIALAALDEIESLACIGCEGQTHLARTALVTIKNNPPPTKC